MHTLKGIRAYLIIVPCPMNHCFQNGPFLILPEGHTTLEAEAYNFMRGQLASLVVLSLVHI